VGRLSSVDKIEKKNNWKKKVNSLLWKKKMGASAGVTSVRWKKGTSKKKKNWGGDSTTKTGGGGESRRLEVLKKLG